MITLVIKKRKNSFIISRNSNWVIISFSIIASLVGGNTFVTFTGFVNQFGISAFFFFLGLALGLLFFKRVDRILIDLQDENNLLITDYIKKYYGKNVGFFMSFANGIRFFLIIIIQYIAGGNLLEQTIGLNYITSIIIISLSIIIYIYLKGFYGVLISDFIQVLLILLSLSICCIFLVPQLNNIPEKHLNVLNIGFMKILLFFIFGIALILGSADIWQRIMCVSSKRELHKSINLSIFTLLFIGSLITLTGLFSVSLGWKNSDTAFLSLFDMNLLPLLIRNLFAIALISAILSTADTFVFGLASIISRDLLKVSQVKMESSVKKQIIVVSFVSIIVSLLFQKILSFAILFANIIFVLSPIFLFHILGLKLRKEVIILSISLGILYSFIITIIPGIPIEASYGTLFISFSLLLFGIRRKELNSSIIHNEKYDVIWE